MTATFSAQAYDYILEKLLTQDLRPGDLLDRKLIARELSISLIPVADAVQRLTQEGFLTTRRRLGTFVTTPTREDVRGQLLLREAIECQAVRLVCGPRLKQARAKLLPLARAADRAVDSGNPLYREDFAFHRELLGLTEVNALVDSFERIATLTMFHQTAIMSPLAVSSYDRHTRLLDDLGQLSPEQADARIRQHIRRGKDALFAPAVDPPQPRRSRDRRNAR